MASGLERRFGSNKLMADFHGKPMIQRILDATSGLYAKRMVVTRHESVADPFELTDADTPETLKLLQQLSK